MPRILEYTNAPIVLGLGASLCIVHVENENEAEDVNNGISGNVILVD